MNSTGWKVTPLGWVALVTIAGLTVYFLGKALRNVMLGKRPNVRNVSLADCTYTPTTQIDLLR